MAECFCDQTLLSPPVDNLGNSSSSLELDLRIAMEGGEGSQEAFFRALSRAWWLCSWSPGIDTFMCAFVSVHSEMEGCCSIFK